MLVIAPMPGLYLEAAASIFGGIETTHQEAGAGSARGAVPARDGEVAMGRRWLDRASRHFELLGGDAGIAYCRELGSKTLQSEREEAARSLAVRRRERRGNPN